MTSVRRASSMRELITCRPLIMMKATTNINAATITGRGITASTAGSLGKNPRTRNMAPTAYATLRLATPIAAASPADCVEVFVPTAPTSPARAVVAPSANTPRIAERMSGRTQSASFMRWQRVIVPTAFMATATLAIANGAASVTSNDQETALKSGRPIQDACSTADSSLLRINPANPAAT